VSEHDEHRHPLALVAPAPRRCRRSEAPKYAPRHAGGIARQLRGFCGGVAAAAVLVGCARPAPLPSAPRAPVDKRSPEVFLNHVYVVLDEASFEAVRASSFLRERFARIDRGLPSFDPPRPDDQAWYVRGENTYLEIFGPRNRYGEAPGRVGVGFGVERPGALLDLFVASQREGLAVAYDLGFVDFDVERPFPWKYNLTVKAEAPGARFAFWTAEYHPALTATLFPGRPSAGGIRRRDFLAPNYKPLRLFRDVVGLRLALAPPSFDALTRHLRAAGYRARSAGGAVAMEGPGVTITLEPAPAVAEGLRALELRLNAAPSAAEAEHTLGASSIRLAAEQGVWTFEPPSGG
jgi:Family of unknown function (DUF5829)